MVIVKIQKKITKAIVMVNVRMKVLNIICSGADYIHKILEGQVIFTLESLEDDLQVSVTNGQVHLHVYKPNKVFNNQVSLS